MVVAAAVADLLAEVDHLAEVAVAAAVVADLGEVFAAAGEALVEGCWRKVWG